MLSFFALFYFNMTVQFLLFRMMVEYIRRIRHSQIVNSFHCLFVHACSDGTWWREEASRSFYLCGCLCLKCCLDRCHLERKAYQTLPIAMVAFWKIKEKY